MRSLLWKEWHEQRWKLAFSSLLLAGFTFFGLHARVVSDAAVLIASSSLAIVLLPLLVGAVMVAPERETGTLQTLMALPANPLSILGAKTVVGLVACIVTLHDPAFAYHLLGPRMMETIEQRKMWTESIVTVKPLASSGIMTRTKRFSARCPTKPPRCTKPGPSATGWA